MATRAGATRSKLDRGSALMLLSRILVQAKKEWAELCLKDNFDSLNESEFGHLHTYLNNVISRLNLFIPARDPRCGITERGGDAILGYLKEPDSESSYFFFADVSGFTALLSFLTDRFGKEEAGDIMNLSILNRFCLNKMGQIISFLDSDRQTGDKGLDTLKIMSSIRASMPLISTEVQSELREKLAGKPHQHEIEAFISKLAVKASGGVVYDPNPCSAFYGSKFRARITWGHTGRDVAKAEKIGGNDDQVRADIKEVKGFAVDSHCFGKLRELLETGWAGLKHSDMVFSEPVENFRKVVITDTGMAKIGEYNQQIFLETTGGDNFSVGSKSKYSSTDRGKIIDDICLKLADIEKHLGNQSLILHIVRLFGPKGTNDILLDDAASSVRNSGVLFCNFAIAGPQLLEELTDEVHRIMSRYGIHYKYNIFPKGDFNLMAVLGTPFMEKRETDRYYSEILWNAWQDLLRNLKKSFGNEVELRGGISIGKALQGPAGDNILHNEETIIGPDCNMAARLLNEALAVDKKGDFLNPSGIVFTTESHRKKIDHLIQPLPAFNQVHLKGFSEPVEIFSLVERHEVESIKEFIGRLRNLPLVTVKGEIVEGSRTANKDEFLKICISVLQEVIGDNKNVPQLIAFIGNSGVGKTRRIAELANYALEREVPVFFGECFSWYQGSGTAQLDVEAGRQAEHHTDEGSHPFFPFVRILKEQIFHISNHDSVRKKEEKIVEVLSKVKSGEPQIAEQAPVIGSFIGLNLPENSYSSALDPEAKRNIFYERVGDIFEYWIANVGDKKTIILCVDDLQWSDHNSLQLLSYLLRRIRKGLVVCVNAREQSQLGRLLDEDLPGERHIFEPDLLTAKASLHLASVVLGLEKARASKELPEDLQDKLINILERNPFFIIEFCKKIVDEEIITVADGEVTRFDGDKFRDTTIPTKIEGVIEDRIRRLTHEEHAAIQFSSVLGNILRYIIIKKFIPNIDRDKIFIDKSLEEIFSRLTGMEITRLENEKDPEWVYSFQRALIGEKLYQELTPSFRKRLHKEVARIFEETELANQFEKAILTALHYSNAEVPNKSCEFYLLAGRLSREVFDNERCLMLYKKIDKLLTEYRISNAGEKRMVLYEDRGRVNLLIGSYTDALQDFELLVKLAREHKLTEKESYGNYLIAQTYFNRSLGGDYDKAVSYFKIACKITRDQRLAAEIKNDWARTLLEKGDHDQALTLLDEAESTYGELKAGATNVPDRIFLANLMRNRGSVYHRKADFKKAIEIYKKALALVADKKENRYHKIRAMLLNSIGLSLMKAFHLKESLKYFKEALTIASSIGDLKTEVLVRNNMGVAYNDQGMNQEALQVLSDQHTNLEALVGETRELAMLKFNIGESHMFMEQYDEVEPWYRQALKIGEHVGYLEFTVATRYNLAELLEQQGRSEEALEVLLPAFELAEKKKWEFQLMDISNLLGEIYRKQKKYSDALSFHRRALEISEELEDGVGKSWSLRNLATDLLESEPAGARARGDCGAMLAESTELARQAGQPENLMHSLKSLIDWKLQFEKQTDSVKNDIRLFIQELENIARKVSSKQFISFCGEMKKKLGI